MTNPATSSAAADILQLDAATQADLQLFSTDADANTLFRFCDRCRTKGGQMVLRRRMAAPWCTAERIAATQEALAFILAQRSAFAELPAVYVVSHTARYLQDPMPVIRLNNRLEFMLAAISFRANDGRFYSKIASGVDLTGRLLQALLSFVAAVQPKTPAGELRALVDELELLLNQPGLAEVCDPGADRFFWRKLHLDQIFRWQERPALERLLQLVYELDALVAMADVTLEQQLVLPDILSGPVRIDAEGLVHPLMDQPIANPLALDQQHRVLLLTGPNMAGKSTYLRTVATALYLAQLGMGVPAQRFAFVPVQHLLTSISLNDNLSDGISYFRAEALRMKAVAQAIADGCRVMAIMDEPFKGTNVKDAFDASLAVLKRLARSDNCLFLVSSHLIELKDELAAELHIDYRYFEAEEQQHRLTFDYKLHPGVSSQRLGMRVLQEEGVFALLDGAAIPEPTDRKNG